VLPSRIDSAGKVDAQFIYLLSAMRLSQGCGLSHLEFGSRVCDPEFGGFAKISWIGAGISEKKFATLLECNARKSPEYA